MSRPKEHNLNRNLTAKLPSRGEVCGAHNALAIKELALLNNPMLFESKEFKNFSSHYNSAKQVLENNHLSFEYSHISQNPPDISNAINCISYILNFKVTSKKDIIKHFGNDSLNLIENKTDITTFKDNLKTNKKTGKSPFSDKVVLLNIALLYCVNQINSSSPHKKNNAISYFILSDTYHPISAIPVDNNYVSYLFAVYDQLQNTENKGFLFSSSLVTLYRAYEKYVVPSNMLINKLNSLQKKHEQDYHKYNDTYIQTIKKHKTELKKAQKELIFFIKDNIPLWQSLEEKQVYAIEAAQEKLEITELISDIQSAFSTSRSPKTVSANYFFSLLIHITSNDVLKRIITILNSLLSINDNYIVEKFYDLSFYILGKYPLKKIDIDETLLINHLYEHSFSPALVYNLANIFINLSEVSDSDQLLIETYIYSANNNASSFINVFNMIVAFNSVSNLNTYTQQLVDNP